MKQAILYIFIEIFFLNMNFAQSFDKIRINESFENQELKEVFSIISKKYNINFAYDDKLVKGIVISKKIKNKTLNETLKILLKNSKLDFKIINNQVLLFKKKEKKETHKIKKKPLFSITGVIKDKYTHDALPFTTVFISGTNTGTVSNVDGKFSLIKLPTDTFSIAAQFLGYQTKELKIVVDKNKYIEIFLEPAEYNLKEILVKREANIFVKASNSGGEHTKINPRMISSVPDYGENDVFRAVQLLPGISGANENSANLYVHGGEADQNLVLFDGFTVYHTDHFYGNISTFNANAIKDVKIFKTGFGANYGDRVSSVIDITGKSGNFNKISGTVNSSLISAGLTLEIPFLNNKASFFVAARRSYTDIFQSYLYKQMLERLQSASNYNYSDTSAYFYTLNNTPEFHFYDVNSKLTFKPNKRDIISFSFYKGYDNFSNEYVSNFIELDSTAILKEQYNTETEWGNFGISAKWSRNWTDKIYSNSHIAYSEYTSYHLNTWNYDISINDELTNEHYEFSDYFDEWQNNSIAEFNVKSSLNLILNNNNKLEAGIQYTGKNVNYEYVMSDTLLYEHETNYSENFAVHLTNEWNISEKFQLNTGLRTVYYNITDQFYFEPRISANYKLNKNISLKAATGKYTQFVKRVVFNDIMNKSNDFWYIADNKDVPVLDAFHFIIGFAINYKKLHFNFDLFSKSVNGYTEYALQYEENVFDYSDTSTVFDVSATFSENMFEISQQYINGLDISFHRNGKYLTSMASYSYIKKSRNNLLASYQDFNLRAFDTKHEFKLINFLKYKNWTFSSTWIHSSGKLPFATDDYAIELSEGKDVYLIQTTEEEATQMVKYHRLDISLSRTFSAQNAKYQIGLSILNLYNKENINVLKYYPEYLENDIQTISISYGKATQLMKFTPTFFVNIKF